MGLLAVSRRDHPCPADRPKGLFGGDPPWSISRPTHRVGRWVSAREPARRAGPPAAQRRAGPQGRTPRRGKFVPRGMAGSRPGEICRGAGLDRRGAGSRPSGDTQGWSRAQDTDAMGDRKGHPRARFHSTDDGFIGRQQTASTVAGLSDPGGQRRWHRGHTRLRMGDLTRRRGSGGKPGSQSGGDSRGQCARSERPIRLVRRGSSRPQRHGIQGPTREPAVAGSGIHDALPCAGIGVT